MNNMYKHEENSIDPRDKNLVTYYPISKTFIVEMSMLAGKKITPFRFNNSLGKTEWYIWVWANKLDTYIKYKQDRRVTDPDGDLVSTIFLPVHSNYLPKEAIGTSLHILND